MNQKNGMVYFGLLIVSLLAAGSCKTPITPKLISEDSKPLLVVEGTITDQEGPFRVIVSNTVGVTYEENNNPVLNADVRIIDDQGHTFQLFIMGKGIYETTERN